MNFLSTLECSSGIITQSQVIFAAEYGLVKFSYSHFLSLLELYDVEKYINVVYFFLRWRYEIVYSNGAAAVNQYH